MPGTFVYVCCMLSSVRLCLAIARLLSSFFSCAGWLALYGKGILHRDPSIGNILKLETPRKNSTVPSVIDDLISALGALSVKSEPANKEGAGENLGGAKTEEHNESLNKVMEALHIELKNLGAFETCVAVLGDFDLSSKLEDHFSREHSLASSLSVSQNMPVRYMLLMEAAGYRGVHV